MVNQRAGLKRRMPGKPARTSGHAKAEAPLKAMTAMPRMAAEAATLAKRMVRGRTGNGESTMMSRRSGKVESQPMTVMRPTMSIMSEISDCSVCQASTTSSEGGGGGPNVEKNAPMAWMRLNMKRMPANWPR